MLTPVTFFVLSVSLRLNFFDVLLSVSKLAATAEWSDNSGSRGLGEHYLRVPSHFILLLQDMRDFINLRFSCSVSLSQPFSSK